MAKRGDYTLFTSDADFIDQRYHNRVYPLHFWAEHRKENYSLIILNYNN